MDLEQKLLLAADLYHFDPNSRDPLCETVSATLESSKELSEDELEFVAAADGSASRFVKDLMHRLQPK